MAFNAKLKDRIEHTCAVCGKKFWWGKRKTTRHCSEECKAIYHSWYETYMRARKNPTTYKDTLRRHLFAAKKMGWIDKNIEVNE